MALERPFVAHLMTFDLLSLNCFNVVNRYPLRMHPDLKVKEDDEEYIDIWCRDRVELRIRLKEVSIRLRLLKQRLQFLQSCK